MLSCLTRIFRKKKKEEDNKPETGMCLVVPSRDAVSNKQNLHIIGGRYYKMNTVKFVKL